MVHQARRDQGKRNITVFGVASDGDSFRYYRIDNESKVRKLSFYLIIIYSLTIACPVYPPRLGALRAQEGNSISTKVDNPCGDRLIPINDSDQRRAATRSNAKEIR